MSYRLTGRHAVNASRSYGTRNITHCTVTSAITQVIKFCDLNNEVHTSVMPVVSLVPNHIPELPKQR
jgi:hypothetical protein